MRRLLIGIGLLVCASSGCTGSGAKADTLILATTTSTRDSGLLEALLPMFKEQTGVAVKVVAVGSGQALELGRRGDADVLLTHAPHAEEEFIAGGFGDQRRLVMHNAFILVGPKADPARIRGIVSASEAFRQIAGSRSAFVSRGDESGTHQKEREVWQRAGVAPEGDWYIRAGAGMAQALRMASEKEAYTLSDRATFLGQRQKLGLILLGQGDPQLRNTYSVIVVHPGKHPHVNQRAAHQFARFLLSGRSQQRIAEFGTAEFGEPLFFPNVRQAGGDERANWKDVTVHALPEAADSRNANWLLDGNLGPHLAASVQSSRVRPAR